jgi:hypothetical protein
LKIIILNSNRLNERGSYPRSFHSVDKVFYQWTKYGKFYKISSQSDGRGGFFMFFSYTRQEVEQNRGFYLHMYDPTHQLVQIDQVMNWYQLHEKLKPYYPKEIGRPTVDPIVLVKILMIQTLEGFRSFRFTCKQVQQNATYAGF